MKVKELIAALEKLPPDLDVCVTDGYQAEVFAGDFEIQVFKDQNGKEWADIGVGGLNIGEEPWPDPS